MRDAKLDAAVPVPRSFGASVQRLVGWLLFIAGRDAVVGRHAVAYSGGQHVRQAARRKQRRGSDEAAVPCDSCIAKHFFAPIFISLLGRGGVGSKTMLKNSQTQRKAGLVQQLVPS
jgi:hypothetical protein